jgi:vacuolar-type H+-ATPase subunit E/Vma4
MMAESIESFVEKLQAEGVEAGRKAAEQLQSDARTEAERIIVEAKADAEAIVAEAQAQAKRIADRERNELDLAIRDAVLAFRARMSAAVESLLSYEVGKALTDTGFLATLIHDVVVNYAHEDARSDEQIRISVNPEAIDAITDWALKYMGSENPEHAHVDLKSTLKTVGFEYRVAESTVEVTLESIVDVLREQVSPALREVLDRSLASPSE